MEGFLALITVISIIALVMLISMYMSLKRKDSKSREEITQLQGQIHQRAYELHQVWVERDCESIRIQERDIAERYADTKLQQWTTEKEEMIRDDTRKKSKATIIGQVTEHLAPYLPVPVFDNYNPKDFRFLGGPIDFLIFDGMTDGEIRNVIFVEVKTGQKPTLNDHQKQVKKAICERRVDWIQLNIRRELK